MVALFSLIRSVTRARLKVHCLFTLVSGLLAVSGVLAAVVASYSSKWSTCLTQLVAVASSGWYGVFDALLDIALELPPLSWIQPVDDSFNPFEAPEFGGRGPEFGGRAPEDVVEMFLAQDPGVSEERRRHRLQLLAGG